MAGFVLGNRRIGGRAEAGVAELRVRPRVYRVAVIGIDDMTRGAATGAIVAGVIVRAGKRHDRVEQARFLETEKNGIGPKLGAETAFAEFVVRFPGIFFAIGIADLGLLAAAPFENAQHVSGLGSFPAEERIELGNYALGANFFGRGPGRSLNRLRLAATIVALAEARVFSGIAAVVVQRCAPQHSGVSHHAGGNGAGFGGVTAGRAAGFGCDAEIARIDEFDILGGFRKPLRVGAPGKRGAIFERRVAGLDVGFFLGGIVFGRIWRGAGCDRDRGVAAMAIRASEMHGLGGVHGGFVGRGVAGDAAGGFAIGFFL